MEFMVPERVERLKRIAAQTWARTLDNRLSLSRDELSRRLNEEAKPLPLRERLLDDKPEHVIAR